jgi:hypothetical protein
MRSYIPDDKLTDRFSQHGSIKSIFRVRNIAFIEFEKIESCAQAKVGCHEQNIYWYTYKKNGFGNEVSSTEHSEMVYITCKEEGEKFSMDMNLLKKEKPLILM